MAKNEALRLPSDEFQRVTDELDQPAQVIPALTELIHRYCAQHPHDACTACHHRQES